MNQQTISHKILYNETFTKKIRVLVITSCTGNKRAKPYNQLVKEDFRDSIRLREREKELAQFSCPAGQLYTGVQHKRVMSGINRLRFVFDPHLIKVRILSAAYGLIEEERKIVPYEVTFNNMKGSEIDEWGKFLGLHQEFERAINGYDLIFVLLGSKYLRSLALPVQARSDQTFIFLASQNSIPAINLISANVFAWPLSNVEAKHYRFASVGLKGFLFDRFAQAVSRKPELLSKVYQKPDLFYQIVEEKLP
jgi:hypothetical protein